MESVRVEGRGGWEMEKELKHRGQPSLLTLKNGRPGAFNNPCASRVVQGKEEMTTNYHSPEPIRKQYSHLVMQS